MKKYLIPVFLFFSLTLSSQTNVRAWYAEGQVWIVWKMQFPLPLTVGVYASPSPFTSTAEATLVGRPFALDYLPTALKEQTDTSATYRIPGDGTARYQLESDEGLFVFTPHQNGALYFAVVAEGETEVQSGVNSTSGATSFIYDPVHDQVQCHVQSVFTSPFDPDFTCFAMYMWVDGRDDYWNSRADFPVMANAAKNGMAGFFFISIPKDLDTTQAFPLSVWLHGGGGTAQQSLAGSRPIIDIDPKKGILVAHNDDVFGRRGDTPPFFENPSYHFGWRKNWNPFSTDNFPSEVDTIINYTQRRYLWIDEWLIRHYNIDTNRIHIHGHSMGSWGSTALAKAYPLHYASATLFNNGFRGPDPGINMEAMTGPKEENFPTNLKNRSGQPVKFLDLFDLKTNISGERDLPVFRSYHAKNDIGEANYWGVDVVKEYQAADSLGLGAALYWSEREHGVDTGPAHQDHWVSGNSPELQTVTDNVDWTENSSRTDLSYPAFFNNRKDPFANDPGDGTPGTGINGVGDDWGTWGGWHRWDNASIVDNTYQWSVDAWLESNAVFEHDNFPSTQLTADLAIRRPQHFLPATGDLLHYEVKDVNSGTLLQVGDTEVKEDNLVVIPQIIVYPESTRKVRITVIRQTIGTKELEKQNSTFSVFPNPSNAYATMTIHSVEPMEGLINIYTINGVKIFQQKIQVVEGDQRIALRNTQQLEEGMYIIELCTPKGNDQKKWLKY